LLRWPPLYPTLLAIIGSSGSFFRLDLFESIRYFNALVYALIVFASGMLYLRLMSSRVLLLIATATLLLNWPLNIIHIHAWSEPVFVLLTQLFLILMARFVRMPGWASLVGLVVLTVLTELQRYAGVTLIATGVFVILLFARDSLRKRLIYAVTFGLPATVPLLLWNLRNLLLSENPIGSGWSITTPRPLTAVITGLDVVGEQFAPPIGVLPVLVGSVLGIMMLFLVLRAFRPSSTLLQVTNPDLIILVLFTVAYLVFMIGSASVANVDLLDRTLVPIFIPLTALVFIALDNLLRTIRQHLPPLTYRIIVPTILALTLIWLGISRWERLSREYPLLNQTCCRETIWEESPLVGWLKNQHLDGILWSNAAGKASVYTGLYIRSLPPPSSLSRRLDPNTESYIIWFNMAPPLPYDLSDLAAEISIEPLVEMADGGVYRVVLESSRKNSEN
jgi:hypothetical protein